MFALLLLLLILFIFLLLQVFGLYSHETFTNAVSAMPNVNNHKATTIADITESRVRKEIQQILQYQQLFGFRTECDKGKTSGNDIPTTKVCTAPKVDASWLPSEPAVKECFSVLIPILEATKCDVHSGITDSTKKNESKSTDKNDKQIDALQKVTMPTNKHLTK